MGKEERRTEVVLGRGMVFTRARDCGEVLAMGSSLQGGRWEVGTMAGESEDDDGEEELDGANDEDDELEHGGLASHCIGAQQRGRRTRKAVSLYCGRA